MDALRGAGFDVREGLIARPPELGDADLVVLHRPNGDAAVELLREARRRGIASVVDADDLFLLEALPANAPFSRVWHPDFKRWQAEARAAAGVDSWDAVEQAPRSRVMETFHACLRQADAVTVTTEPLAEAYTAFNTNIHILPNCYDDEKPLWHLPRPVRTTVNIGFAGTAHHDDNLVLLKGALEPILRAHPNVNVVEGGGPALLPLIDAPAERLVHMASVPFGAFPLLLRQMDIVLAPLADQPFMRSKSNIRCMTAGLVGAPVVASPVGPYATYVKHGHNGFLARSPAEWTDALDQLVSDPVLRERMGAANRQQAHNYAISANIHKWINVYAGLLSRRRA
jgi:glycosyltransferase involved in cell wall biosynthesis